MQNADKIYAVIDTNVIVSAMISSNSHSNPNIVVNAVNNGIIIPLYNEIIESEYKEVLSRSYFKLTAEQIDIFISTLRNFGIKTESTTITNEFFPDPDDIVFYEVKMSVDNSYLVTGNLKHFPKKPFVVTPAQMVEILKERKLL